MVSDYFYSCVSLISYRIEAYYSKTGETLFILYGFWPVKIEAKTVARMGTAALNHLQKLSNQTLISVKTDRGEQNLVYKVCMNDV